MTTLGVVGMLYLIAIPLVAQILTSLRGPYLPFGLPSSAWTLEDYRAVYALFSDFAGVLIATAGFVLGSMLVSLTIAAVCAWLVVRTDLPGRDLLYGLLLVPYIIPPIVRAQAYTLMLAPTTGILNQALRLFPFFDGPSGPIDGSSFALLVVAQGLAGITFLFVLLVPVLENMNATLEEAARMAGASPLQAVLRIVVPVLRPGVLSVVLLGLILTLGSFEIPFLLGARDGAQIFALKLWYLVNSIDGELPKYGVAAAYGVNFMVLTFALFYLYSRATRQAERFAVVSGKGFRQHRHPLGRLTIPALVFVGALVTLIALMPLVSLLWSAVTPYPMPMSRENLAQFGSLAAFDAVAHSALFWQDLGRTVVVAGASATIAVGLGAIAGRAVARGEPGLRTRLLDLLASSSLAIPATIAGFSAFLFYLITNKALGLFGTLWVLILAYSYRFAVAYRVSLSGLSALSPELEEAAATSGASVLTTFRRIGLPLLFPTLAAVWIQLFVLGAQEMTIAVFLTTPDNETLPILIFNAIRSGGGQQYAPNQGAVMALYYTVLVFVITIALRRLGSQPLSQLAAVAVPVTLAPRAGPAPDGSVPTA